MANIMRKTLLYLSERKNAGRVIMGMPPTRTMALRFVAGERLQQAVDTIRQLNKKGFTASIDHLGENVNTAAEAAQSAKDYLDALDAITDAKVNGNVSLKLTQMGLDLGDEVCLENMRKILDRARQDDIFVRLDMEGSAYTQKTLDFHRKLWDEGYRNVGVVLQSYLYRTMDDVKAVNAAGIRVRLCKGAYMEPPSVAFPKKSDVDDNYLKCAKLLLTEGNYPGLATHDEVMIDAICQYVNEQNIDRSKFEFQMLYGIRPQLQERLIKDGYNLRVYVPYGNQWYPYFMRRLAERPANLMFILGSLVKK